MGLLANILRRPNDRKVASSPYFKTFTEYAPVFSTFRGSLYEQLLTRSAVERVAVSCSKLKPEVVGSAKPRVRRAIATSPNDYMTWPQFLSRVATILEVDTTAYVVPAYDASMNVVGVYPLKAEYAEVVEYGDEAWIRFHLASGDVAAIELANVAVLTRFQYESDVFGSGNSALSSTLELMDAQDQAQRAAIRNGATIRFIGQLGGTVRPEDIEAKRKEFAEKNLGASNDTGLMLYDNTFDRLSQVEEQHYTIDSDEMRRIQESVYTYFGVNENILHSDFSEEQWGAFYESVVEPIAVQLSEGLTGMLYTRRERAAGNRISFSANRLEYASNASKRNMIRDMLDRGVFTINEAREILQLPPVEWGDAAPIRGEYKAGDMALGVSSGATGNAAKNYSPFTGSKLSLATTNEKDFDLGGDDQIYNDTDGRGEKEEDD